MLGLYTSPQRQSSSFQPSATRSCPVNTAGTFTSVPQEKPRLPKRVTALTMKTCTRSHHHRGRRSCRGENSSWEWSKTSKLWKCLPSDRNQLHMDLKKHLSSLPAPFTHQNTSAKTSWWVNENALILSSQDYLSSFSLRQRCKSNSAWRNATSNRNARGPVSGTYNKHLLDSIRWTQSFQNPNFNLVFSRNWSLPLQEPVQKQTVKTKSLLKQKWPMFLTLIHKPLAAQKPCWLGNSPFKR